jgi:hypothetical protein
MRVMSGTAMNIFIYCCEVHVSRPPYQEIFINKRRGYIISSFDRFSPFRSPALRCMWYDLLQRSPFITNKCFFFVLKQQWRVKNPDFKNISINRNDKKIQPHFYVRVYLTAVLYILHHTIFNRKHSWTIFISYPKNTGII